MVLITDGGPGNCLHAYISATPGNMVDFEAATEDCIATHPPSGDAPGDWANLQIAFIPDKTGHCDAIPCNYASKPLPKSRSGKVVRVAYTLWDGTPVRRGRGGVSHGYTMTVYNMTLQS